MGVGEDREAILKLLLDGKRRNKRQIASLLGMDICYVLVDLQALKRMGYIEMTYDIAAKTALWWREL